MSSRHSGYTTPTASTTTTSPTSSDAEGDERSKELSEPKKRQQLVLSSAPPPWHSVLVLLTVISISLYLFPTFQSLDETATLETFTSRVFPELLTLRQLAYIRLAFAATIWIASIQGILGRGNYVIIPYLPSSKLKKVPFLLKGFKSLTPFTAVAWNLLGLAFSLSGYTAWKAANANDVSTIMLRSALIVWEIAAPYTLLVATVVRYVIWPMVLKESAVAGDTTTTTTTTAAAHVLINPRALLQHNVNVLFAVSETALLGGVPVVWQFVPFSTLTGCLYIVFSWAMAPYWVKNLQQDGIQFVYFFFDTTLPGYTHSVVLIALLLVLMAFFALFVWAENLLEALPTTDGVLPHVLFVVGMCAITNRWRD